MYNRQLKSDQQLSIDLYLGDTILELLKKMILKKFSCTTNKDKENWILQNISHLTIAPFLLLTEIPMVASVRESIVCFICSKLWSFKWFMFQISILE